MFSSERGLVRSDAPQLNANYPVGEESFNVQAGRKNNLPRVSRRPRKYSKAWNREMVRQAKWKFEAEIAFEQVDSNRRKEEIETIKKQKEEEEGLTRELIAKKFNQVLERMREGTETMSDIEFGLMHGLELVTSLTTQEVEVVQGRIKSGNGTNADVITIMLYQLNQGNIEDALTTRNFLREPANLRFRPHTTHFDYKPLDAVDLAIHLPEIET